MTNCTCNQRIHPTPTFKIEVNGFTRMVVFSPGYVCEQPTGTPTSHGKHGMDITFYLKGKEGAVQFKIFTHWTPDLGASLLSWNERILPPMAADLGYHSPTPTYEDQGPISDSCWVLDDAPCYYDGSSLNAEPVFDKFLKEGEAGMWKELEYYYWKVFRPEDTLSA